MPRIMNSSNAFRSPVDVDFCTRRTTASGKPATMPAKMMSEMPLPMPRSVICSPSHMMKQVPVVSEITVISSNVIPGLATTVPYWP